MKGAKRNYGETTQVISRNESEEMQQFFDEYIRDKKYNILVLGDVEKLDFDILSQFGEVNQLTLEEIFGY